MAKPKLGETDVEEAIPFDQVMQTLLQAKPQSKPAPKKAPAKRAAKPKK